MTEREVKLRAVIAWCLACEWSVTDFHFLFSRIYNVIHYFQLLSVVDTPESTSMASMSLDNAVKDLHAFMMARCFPIEIRDAVVWLYNH